MEIIMRMRRPKLIPVIAVGAIFAVPTGAQVSAHQGSPDSHQIASPMILEVPLPVAEESTRGKRDIPADASTRQYSCENVYFSRLTFSALKPVSETVDVNVNFTLANRPGHDKLVDAVFETFRDGKPIGLAGIVRNIDV